LTRIVAYQINPDGHWDPVAFSASNLKAKEVFILVDDSRKEIWIWIGQGAHVKTRFISSTAASEIRRLYGFTYRVKTVDQGLEPQIFLDCINSIPDNGIVPELKTSEVKSQVTTKKPKTKVSATKKRTKKSPRKTSKTTAKTKPKVKAKSKTTIAKKPTSRTSTTTKGKTKPKKTTKKPMKELDTYLPQDTSVITTPPCPECEIGYLLPYSEVIEEEGREPFILPFSKWICSKCRFSPEKSL
jgi:hypothetical protein